MLRIITATASLCFLLGSVNGWAAEPAPSKPPAANATEGVTERLERMGPPHRGMRESATPTQPIEIAVNGAKKATFTGSDLNTLQPISTSRSGDKSWSVVDILKKYGIDKGKSVDFYNNRNKKVSLSWDQLLGQKEKAIFTYNRRGELILLAGVAKQAPGTTDQQREQMRKDPQRNPNYLHDVRRMEVVQ
jgi:hypothetical protein